MKKKITLVSIFFVLLQFLNPIQAQWVQVNSGTEDGISEISVFDNDRLICCTGGGNILMSDDVGETWFETNIVSESLVSVDAEENLAVALSDNGLVFRSVDYGNSWEQITYLYYTMRGIEIYSNDKIYVCGDDEMVWESSDNMMNWSYIPYILGNGYWLRDIHFTDEINGYIVGDGGTGFKTPNASYGWFKMDTRTSENLKSISFPATDTGYICGKNSVVLKTTDGGITWMDVLEESYGSLVGTCFLSTEEGYVCGENGLMLYTNDGGETWTQEETNISNGYLNKMCYHEGYDRIIAVGQNGNIIYKDLLISLDEKPTADENSHVSIYPNPAKNKISVHIRNIHQENLQFAIYSVDGKLQYNSGIHNMENQQIDISDFATGMYHYQLYRNGKEISSGTFIKE